MPGIGIISNPHSRRNRRYPEQMRRLAYVLGRDDTYELTNRIDDVSDAAEQFLESDIDILALNGGDGTNHVTLTKFIEVYGDKPLPKIALLRGGTMNTVSNAIGVKGTPARLLANLVEKYYTDQPFETTHRDLLRIDDETGTRYGFIFGNGVVANFLELYYGAGDPSPATAAKLLATAVGSLPFDSEINRQLFKPFTASIELDEEMWPSRDYTAVLASTVDQIGLGFRPFIRCQERKSSFHILGVTEGPLGVALQLPRMRLGLPVDEEHMRSSVSDKAIFRSAEPIVYTIDGDMHRSEDGVVEMHAGPRLEIILK
ncbi:MAG: diacylglycerol/lipid kinase family protein [Myxococcota bacterium]